MAGMEVLSAESTEKFVGPADGQLQLSRVVDMSTEFTFTATAPGWTMFMVGHFHDDLVWLNTQANYTSAR